MTTEIPSPPNGWELRSTQAIAAALGWQADSYNAVQAFTRKSAAKYLDLRIPFSLQSAVAVKEICRVVRERFLDLPKYKDDWHVKAILHRYLLSTSRRSPRKHGYTNITNNRHDKRLGRSPNFGAIVVRPPAPSSQLPLASEPQDLQGPVSLEQTLVQPAATVSQPSRDASIVAVRHEHWRTLPIYHVVSLGHPLWVHLNTSLFPNVLARSAAQLLGITCPQASGHDLPSVQLQVDLAGLKEEIIAVIADSLPNEVDLILGISWMRRHDGRWSWCSGRYFFTAETTKRLHWFEPATGKA